MPVCPPPPSCVCPCACVVTDARRRIVACRYLRLLEPSEWILKKVEEKLGFLLFRLPWYVNLEKRSELNYMEMLPAVGGGPRTGEASSSGSSGGFNAPGRPLGSV